MQKKKTAPPVTTTTQQGALLKAVKGPMIGDFLFRLRKKPFWPVSAHFKAPPVEKGRKKVVEKDRKNVPNFARGCSAFLGNFCLSIGNGAFDSERA